MSKQSLQVISGYQARSILHHPPEDRPENTVASSQGYFPLPHDRSTVAQQLTINHSPFSRRLSHKTELDEIIGLSTYMQTEGLSPGVPLKYLHMHIHKCVYNNQRHNTAFHYCNFTSINLLASNFLSRQ